MSDKKHFSVLLIDDNEIDNLINQKMLEAADLSEHIYVCSSAKSAIEFLRNMEKLPYAAEILPDMIFLDIDMPLMDGFQFLDLFAKLREETRKKCEIIMLTSSINPSDISKSKSYEYVKRYINKPLSQKNLNELMQEA